MTDSVAISRMNIMKLIPVKLLDSDTKCILLTPGQLQELKVNLSICTFSSSGTSATTGGSGSFSGVKVFGEVII